MHWRKIFYAPANLSKLPSFRADLGVANILISAQIRSTLAGKQAFQSDGLPPKGTNVPAIRIHLSAGGLLAFDLKEVLAALGPSGLITYWAVGDVACRGGNFDATGEGAVALEELAVSGERIIGSRLAHIAESVQQVIWGEFKGYEGILSNAPLVVVIAFDSSWWEVQSADATLLDRVAKDRALGAGTVHKRIGQCLEIATYRALLTSPLTEFQGRFRDLNDHDDSTLYKKEEPQQHIGARELPGDQRLDFLARHPEAGYLGLECKNTRPWLYSHDEGRLTL